MSSKVRRSSHEVVEKCKQSGVGQAARFQNCFTSVAAAKLYNLNHLQVKQFLHLLELRQVVSRITAQHGLSTTGSRQHTMPRQVPRECRNILQHHRYKLPSVCFLAGFCFSGYRYFFACLLLCYLWSMHLFFFPSTITIIRIINRRRLHDNLISVSICVFGDFNFFLKKKKTFSSQGFENHARSHHHLH